MGGNASYKRTALFSNLRADVGIGPYAVGGPLPLGRAYPWLLGVPSTPVPGCARSTLSKQERAKKGQRRKSLAQKALWDRLLCESSGAGTGDAAKDHKVGNGGAAQTVGAVDASGDLTGSEQAGDDGAIFLQHFG